MFDVKFLLNPSTIPGSEVQNGVGLPISTDFIDGTITVTVPEPATAVLFVGAVLTLFLRRR